MKKILLVLTLLLPALTVLSAQEQDPAEAPGAEGYEAGEGGAETAEGEEENGSALAAELERILEELVVTQEELEKSQGELTQAQTDLRSARTELAKSNANMQTVRTYLEKVQTELEKVQTELAQAREELGNLNQEFQTQRLSNMALREQLTAVRAKGDSGMPKEYAEAVSVQRQGDGAFNQGIYGDAQTYYQDAASRFRQITTGVKAKQDAAKAALSDTSKLLTASKNRIDQAETAIQKNLRESGF
jgi:predicted  nucleic acid-binding Zn-ribbon protein